MCRLSMWCQTSFLLIVNNVKLDSNVISSYWCSQRASSRTYIWSFFTEAPEESKHVLILSFWVEYQIRKFSIDWLTWKHKEAHDRVRECCELPCPTVYFILYPIVYSLVLYYWSVTLFFSRHFQITNLSIVKTKNIIIIILSIRTKEKTKKQLFRHCYVTDNTQLSLTIGPASKQEALLRLLSYK